MYVLRLASSISRAAWCSSNLPTTSLQFLTRRYNASSSKSKHGLADKPDYPTTWPHPIFSSEGITHQKSGFQAHASVILCPPTQGSNLESTFERLFDRLVELFPRTKRATHCMYAWRSSVNETPSSAIRRVSCGSCDGGESGAGERLERLLEMSGCENAVVVVYRWYGGVPLGSNRWKCISGVAKEALRAGGFTGEKMAQKPHVDNAKEKRARRKR